MTELLVNRLCDVTHGTGCLSLKKLTVVDIEEFGPEGLIFED